MLSTSAVRVPLGFWGSGASFWTTTVGVGVGVAAGGAVGVGDGVGVNVGVGVALDPGPAQAQENMSKVMSNRRVTQRITTLTALP